MQPIHKFVFLPCVVAAGAVALSAALISPSFQPAGSAISHNASGGNPYVILVRHGDAPGRGEPAEFDLNDCNSQRNLSNKGRDEARELGKAIKARGINVTRVVASRWCRTQETAQLLDLAPVESSSAFDNLDMNKHRAATLMAQEREAIASWDGPGVLLVVTHSSNILLLTGMDIEQGAMIVAPSIDSGPTFKKVALQVGTDLGQPSHCCDTK